MDKIRIRIDNYIQSLRLFKFDKLFQRLLLLEGIVLITALGMLLFYVNTLPRIDLGGTGISRTAPDKREEIAVLSSDLFENEKFPSGVKHAVFAKLNLTGIGKVKGIYKVSIEDAQGNYYYVREGESVKGLIVKKISGQEALLIDKEGNQLTLKLER